MLDLNTGAVTLCGRGAELSSGLSLEQFQRTVPPQQIHRTWRVSTGYTWFYLYGRVFPSDRPFLMDLCFSPEGRLSMLDLYPHILQGAPRQEPDWSGAAGQRNKDLCDRWLEDRCGLVLTGHRLGYSWQTFPWGKITTYYDPRGGSSGIAVGYGAS